MIYISLSLLIGVMGVLQNTINKKFAETLGIATTTLLNNVSILLFGILFYCLVRVAPQFFPELFRVKAEPLNFSLKYLIPGFLGFLIIVMAPYSIEKLGAAKAFMAIIVCQLITSMLWDKYCENIPVTFAKVLGAAVAGIGAFISFM